MISAAMLRKCRSLPKPLKLPFPAMRRGIFGENRAMSEDIGCVYSCYIVKYKHIEVKGSLPGRRNDLKMDFSSIKAATLFAFQQI